MTKILPATNLLRSICLILINALILSGIPCVAKAAETVAPKPESAKFLITWGEHGSGPGQFSAPIDIAISTDDKLFVTDHYNDRVQSFDTNGKFISQFSVLPNPGGLALDGSGNFHIMHFAAAKTGGEKPGAGVYGTIYSPEGKLLRQWGKRGTGDGEFDCPGGLAVTKDGRLYVADQTNHRIQVFDAERKFLFKWGEYGNEPGQFGGKEPAYSRTGGPQFVTLDSEGNVWTTEGANGRIQNFSHDGKFLLAWGDNEDKPGHFGGTFAGFQGQKVRLQGPVSLRFDKKGQLWVSAVSGRIQRFSPAGEFQCGLPEVEGGPQGDKPGQFYAPHGLALDSHGDLYVVDGFNHRIQKFDVPD